MSREAPSTEQVARKQKRVRLLTFVIVTALCIVGFCVNGAAIHAVGKIFHKRLQQILYQQPSANQQGQSLVLAHVVSPFQPSKTSDNWLVQRVVLTSMLHAKNKTQNATVGLYAAVFPEDKLVVPPGFILLPYLNRSTVTEYPALNFQKKLPFINDIISRLYDSALEADFLIFTNSDIGVQEHFYDAIVDLIARGHASFSINRRTINKQITTGERVQSPEKLLEFASHQKGQKHPGLDCFVFKRDVFARFSLGNIFLGYPRVGHALRVFLTTYAENYTIFRDEFLTFHFGNDRTWKPLDQLEFVSKNIENCVEALSASPDINSTLPILLGMRKQLDELNVGKHAWRG